MVSLWRLLLTLLFFAPFVPVSAAQPSDFSGSWAFVSERSTAIDPWRRLELEILVEDDSVVLKRLWSGTREMGGYTDSVHVVPGGPPTRMHVGRWARSLHLGAYIGGDSTKTITAHWADDGRTLVTESTLTLLVQQGERRIRIYTEYRLAPGDNRLYVLELRSTRPRPIHYLFTRSED